MGKSYLASTVERHDKRIAFMSKTNEQLKNMGIKSVYLVECGSVSRPTFLPTPTEYFYEKNPECKVNDAFNGTERTSVEAAVRDIAKIRLPEMGRYRIENKSIVPNSYKTDEACTNKWREIVGNELFAVAVAEKMTEE